MFIEIDGLNDELKEPEVMPDGLYNLQITDIEVGKSKSGRDMFTLNIEFVDHPEARGFRHWLTFPSQEDTSDTRKFMLLNMKRFFDAFGVEYENGVSTESIKGATGVDVPVKLSSTDDGKEYNELGL